ncbi:hypothetical protein [Frankia sp. Cppng1_Ct_nod]|uniref:hypothetical protein n=1 Tax=Frankia sp. Cppng1_Ct_nod TaxID=2897162 RepID=UPI0010410EEA|nr:hypothetical protein [Frankia sp. Cppng1_Ct_nod]
MNGHRSAYPIAESISGYHLLRTDDRTDPGRHAQASSGEPGPACVTTDVEDVDVDFGRDVDDFDDVGDLESKRVELGHAANREPRSTGRGGSVATRPRVGGRLGGLLLAAGGCAAGVAAVLPWSTLSSGDETRTFTGLTVGDGRITLMVGAVLLVMGVVRLVGRRTGVAAATIAVVLGAGVAALAAFDLAMGPPSLAAIRGLSANQFSVVPERGLILTLAAGLVALAGGSLVRRACSDR